MTRKADMAVGIYEFLSGGRVRRCLREVDRHLGGFASLSDKEIVAACRQLTFSPKLPGGGGRSPFKEMRRADLGKRDAEALALAAEAFSRFPPRGLGRGARLYDEQILAAAQLVRGALVQMDTGEGKTFAIAAAALALLRIHPKVYVLTANRYLAARDAENTAPFWGALGISVGVGWHEDRTAEQWKARVVYTTLDSLLFRSMEEDLGVEETIKWAAVLIDEADEILLDKSTRVHTTIRYIKDSRDWSQALEIAASLEEEEDVRVDVSLSTSSRLTLEGEARVVALAGAGEQRPADRLLLIRKVELAYTALRVVKEGHDYEVSGDRIVTIDPASGWHTPNIRFSWVPPLEQHLGLPPGPNSVARHFTDGMTVLRRFDHIAGASGTIIDEALDYALLLQIAPALVPPRRPRQEGLGPEVIAITRERAHEWIVDSVAEHAPSRPVLVATGSTVEAQELADRLRAVDDLAGVHIRAVTDETIAAERVFETAGQPGVVIVSTRVAGRGVDIQITPEAREHGGAMLFAVGHSLEPRLDRQLLGRVGREGDPYSAQFVNHIDDPLLRRVRQKALKAILANVAVDGLVESGTLRPTISSTQRSLRRQRLQMFVLGVSQGAVKGEAMEMLREWRRALGPQGDGSLSDDFLVFLADRFLAARFPAFSYEDRVSISALAAAAEELVRLTGDSEAEARRLTGAATGDRMDETRKVFSDYLVGKLRDATLANRRACRELGERTSRAERAAREIRLDNFLGYLAVKGGAESVDDPQALDAALRASVDTAGIAVPMAAVLETVHTGRRAGMGPDDLLFDLAKTVAEGDGGDREKLVAGFDPRWKDRSLRRSWSIVSETIDRATQQMESGLNRAHFQVVQTVSSARFLSAYRSRVEDLRREIEVDLAGDACSYILAGGKLSELDELFFEREHEVAASRPKLESPAPALPAPEMKQAPILEPAPSTEADALIVEYAIAARERFGKYAMDEERMVLVLKAAMGGLPLSVLNDPDRVAQVYADWKGSDVRRHRIPPWRWRSADGWVKGFFFFLHERGLAAPIPTGIQQRSRSLMRRAWRRVSNPGVALAFLGLGTAMAVMALLTLLAPVGQGFDFGPPMQLLTNLLSGGAFAAGLPVGPVVLALVGAMWVRFLFGAPTTGDAGLVPGERWGFSVLLLVSVLALVQPWARDLGWGLANAVLICLALISAGFVVRNSLYRFEQLSHYHLIPLLAACFAAFAALPQLASTEGTSGVWLAAGAVGFLLLASLPVRRGRIGVLAIASDERQGEPESIEASLPVTGRLSVVPHALALAFAWAVSCVLLQAGVEVSLIAAALAYLLVLLAWARSLAESVTDPEVWQERMRGREQAYDGSSPGSNLTDALVRVRRRIFFAEASVAVLVVGCATALTSGTSIEVLHELPLGMAVVCVATITIDLAIAFGRSLAVPLFGLVDVSAPDQNEEEEGSAAKIRALVERYTRRMGVVIVLTLLLREVADVVSITELVLRVVHLLF